VNRNDGISITGGNVSAGGMAAGDHASVTVNAGGDVVLAARPDVAPLLQALVAALAEHREELPAAVTSAGAEVAAELAGPEPSRARVRELLGTVTEGAGSVSAVTEAAKSLWGVLSSLW
jgi:hypothetical protein